ncbi:LPXTG cell wall anchor domain-containing protein [Gulosibacter bifidus]|uniref:LPXTG cell wall anchor domain-containing protein n=1 Tax=Gulosibacter bifidus TaxID=272239 RepID=A0ABW5RL58_9MICO
MFDGFNSVPATEPAASTEPTASAAPVAAQQGGSLAATGAQSMLPFAGIALALIGAGLVALRVKRAH